jgi:glycosyltransferase involved in cell wall biosynthesis
MARDVVFTLWGETYSDALKREFMPPDRLAQALQVSDRVGKLILANPFRSALTFLPKQIAGTEATGPLTANTTLVRPLRIRRREETDIGELETAYARYDRIVARAARQRRFSEPAVITTNPLYAAYGAFDWARSVTYYAWDDWAAHIANKPWWPAINDAYRRIRERGHRVCAVSRPLLSLIDPTGPGEVIENGLHEPDWQAPWTVPAWVEDLPRPRILYAGSIHGRLNVELIRQTVERFQDGSVIVIGPVADHEVARSLAQIPGLIFKGSISREAVTGLSTAVDVCIMPHHRTPLTESMSPLKLYESIAAGKPSAVSDLPPVHNVHPRVRIVADDESFPEAVAEAIALGPVPEPDRQAFVRANSWGERHGRIMDLAFT